MGNNPSNEKNNQCQDCLIRKIIYQKPWPNDEELLIGLKEERDLFVTDNAKLKLENEKLKKNHQEYNDRLKFFLIL